MGSIDDAKIKNLARKYSLLNAVEHHGRADQGSILGRILAEFADLRNDADRVRAIVREMVAEINSTDKQSQLDALNREYPDVLKQHFSRKKEFAKKESEREPTLPELPDANTGAVVTRFPPEPNGYMHIGHAKAAIIGSEYAKRYNGKFIVRFDDTNPAAEKREYYGEFIESLDWLEIKPDVVKNASDDLQRFYEQAERMIEKGKAFVCTCSQEKMRESRNKMIECEHRSHSPAENRSLWSKMINGALDDLSPTLRFRGEMKSVNTTMRDPVLFRIVKEAHPLKDTEYKVWPTYDFDGPIEDSLDGITHAMRSKEYELRDELYYAILKSLDLRVPRIIEFSRLSLRNTTVSKRNLRKLIDSGDVQGWDDPRLPTIAGLKRRGILPRAIREFVLSMGVSKVESEPTWDLLESINRKILDPVAKRFFFVADPVKLTVENSPSLNVRLRNHPERDLGERKIDTTGEFWISGEDATKVKPGSDFRLIEAYNVKITSVRDNELIGEYQPQGNVESIPKLQWVTDNGKFNFVVKVPGPLLVDDKFNPQSLKSVDGFAEKSVSKLPIGEIIQFVRFGFCRIDSYGVAILSNK